MIINNTYTIPNETLISLTKLAFKPSCGSFNKGVSFKNHKWKKKIRKLLSHNKTDLNLQINNHSSSSAFWTSSGEHFMDAKTSSIGVWHPRQVDFWLKDKPFSLLLKHKTHLKQMANHFKNIHKNTVQYRIPTITYIQMIISNSHTIPNETLISLTKVAFKPCGGSFNNGVTVEASWPWVQFECFL